MQISPKQIKLARIHLEWTQTDLAKFAGVSKDTILNLENGKNLPQQANFDKIVSTLRNAGIEFLEGNGVRERQANIERHHGAQGFKEFMDDVYQTAKEHGGDICLFNSKPSLWHKYLGKEWYGQHSQRMKELEDNIRVRIIVSEGDTEFILGSAEHRWFTKDKWKGKIFYAYGPKLAFLDFGGDTVSITVFEGAEFAESFKIMFDVVWEYATQEPSQSE